MIQIEKITWEAFEPTSFPCFVCKGNKAEFKMQLQHKGISVTSCICQVCANLPEAELVERILGG